MMIINLVVEAEKRRTRQLNREFSRQLNPQGLTDKFVGQTKARIRPTVDGWLSNSNGHKTDSNGHKTDY